MILSELKNTHRPKKKVQRVGRGPGSKRGKTSCRGHKGNKSRSGYKNKYGYEGGQLPLYRKMPTRGFSNARFKKEKAEITLEKIEELFQDGEIVNLETLALKGYGLSKTCTYLKVLSNGDLTKKVKIEASAFSAQAIEKLTASGIEHIVL